MKKIAYIPDGVAPVACCQPPPLRIRTCSSRPGWRSSPTMTAMLPSCATSGASTRCSPSSVVMDFDKNTEPEARPGRTGRSRQDRAGVAGRTTTTT